MTILFYTSISRLFRATGLGHLYEITQKHKVILLTEELDDATEKILNDKSYFPSLSEIIEVHQFSGPTTNIFKRNKRLFNQAKKIVKKYQPDVIIGCDMYLFELYLMRFAKKLNSLNLSLQTSLQIPMRDARKYMRLVAAHNNLPKSLPLWLKLLLITIKKRIAHVVYYWLLPITVGQLPFPGKSSMILWKGSTAMRLSHYYIVPSERNYNITIDDGLDPQKTYILPHPLTRESKSIFQKAYGILSSKHDDNRNLKTVTIMYPEIDIGFVKKDNSSLPKSKIVANRKKIIKMISTALADWTVYIKPHPARKDWKELKQLFNKSGNNIIVVNPSEPADKYIAKSTVIIGIPPASTTLYTASLLCSDHIILSIDLLGELYGDIYQNHEKIDHVNTESTFINKLRDIHNQTYKYTPATDSSDPLSSNLTGHIFNNTLDILEYLYKYKHRH